jgi:hypothetical protein
VLRKIVLGLLMVSVLVVMLAACRESSTPVSTVDLDVNMRVDPQPPAVGDSTLIVTVMDGLGNPVDSARVDVRGDMNHAGMVPVLRDVEGGEGGEYRVPFEWTMGGDWIVTVTVTLADGGVATHDFDVSNVLSARINDDIDDMSDMSDDHDMDGMGEMDHGDDE